MRPTGLFIKIFISVLLSTAVFSTRAQARPPQLAPARQEATQQIQQLLFQRQYAEAEQKIRHYQQQWPDDVMGDFGMMMLYQLKNFENFDQRYAGQYLKWHELGRKKAVDILENGQSSAWDLFVASGVLALSGFHRLNSGKTMRALRDGSMAINALKKAQKKAPGWADPSLGLGLYDYWRSVFTKRWTFLPFFPDKRASGIKDLELVAAKGVYVRELAQGALAWVYYNEEKTAAAQRLNQPLLQRYPRNIVIRLLAAHIAYKQKHYQQAEQHYQTILRQEPRLSKVHFYLARLYLDRAKSILNTQKKSGEISPEVRQDLEQAIAQVSRYLKVDAKAKKQWRGLAYTLWGESLYQLQQWDEAEAKFKLALKQDYSLSLPKKRLRILRNRPAA